MLPIDMKGSPKAHRREDPKRPQLQTEQMIFAHTDLAGV